MGRKKLRHIIGSIAYPPGSIYATNNGTITPQILSELFGGEWRQLKDTFLLSADSAHTLGSTGGSKIPFIPSHVHYTKHTHNNTSDTQSSTGHRHAMRMQKSVASGTNYQQFNSWSSSAADYTTSSNGGHTHTMNSQSTSDMTATGVSSTTGNMPPYQVVHFFERTGY